jgi:hypothetical protein
MDIKETQQLCFSRLTWRSLKDECQCFAGAHRFHLHGLKSQPWRARQNISPEHWWQRTAANTSTSWVACRQGCVSHTLCLTYAKGSLNVCNLLMEFWSHSFSSRPATVCPATSVPVPAEARTSLVTTRALQTGGKPTIFHSNASQFFPTPWKLGNFSDISVMRII